MLQKSYWLETYGCQMNKAESEALRIALREAGFAPSEDPADADLVILNTCSVRKTAEERVWGRLGFYRHLKKERNFVLAIIGCMGERLKKAFVEKIPEIDIVVGTFQKQRLIDAVEEALRTHTPQVRAEYEEYRFAGVHSLSDFKAFVPIIHGCNNFCSYCIVPYVRGREISRHPEEILKELHLLEERNVQEVTLLGQNVNSYQFIQNGTHLTFPKLLDKIKEETSNIPWIRFLTSHPKDCTMDLIERIAASSIFCRHLHLPVQHGSNKILTLMNRGYSREDYLTLIRMIKNTISDVTITTDILIGFPTEEEEDLVLTKALMEEVEFDDAFTYYYNPREGTGAAELCETVPGQEKLRRLQEIIELNIKLKAKRKRERLGRKAAVLVEAVSKKAPHELVGRTEHDEMAVFQGPEKLIGTFVTIRLEALSGTTFRAILC
jgi:tRNA-2-methylthio-N6-dimethylallyladenosine synthase